MAPVIQPPSLYEACLQQVTGHLDLAFTNIYLEAGSYDRPECVDAVCRLQTFLQDTLAVAVFETLAERRNSSVSIRQRRHHELVWNKDSRIKLGLFMHPCLVRFAVDAKGNELMTALDGGLDETFWCSHLRRLTNLTHLNLNLITTDGILLAIGHTCHKLEVVNIVARIKQMYTEASAASSSDVVGAAAGISLKFCVSDVGISALLNCHHLRHISMNKAINYGSTNRGITYAGIRELVKGLPKLQFINFGAMGRIILHRENASAAVDADRPLRLTYFSESDAAFMDIARLQRLCPHIAHISLSIPIKINALGQLDANVTPCNDILTALAESALQLKVVELQHFPFGDGFQRLLRAKGPYLEELLFRAIDPMSSKHIAAIGEHCPRLRKIQLKELGPESGPSFVAAAAQSTLQRRGFFPDLRTLYVSGRLWDANAVLPLLLANAHNVQKISMLNMSNERILDGAIEKVLRRNRLDNVASIYFYTGCFISLPLIRQLIFSSPKLTCLSFLQHETIELAEVEALRAQVTRNNLDIKLCCLELFEF